MKKNMFILLKKMNYFTANQDIFVKRITKEALYFSVGAFLVYQYVRRN